MRRTTVVLSAALMLLAVVPASALARHHHRRHHPQVRHARIEHFGRDATGAPATSNSADNAGTVQSFSHGVLTVMLDDGSTVSGAVVRDTELECAAPEHNRTGHEQAGRRGDEPGGDKNENQAADQDENEMENCSTADLTHGAVVREAELRISSAGSVWEKVELGF